MTISGQGNTLGNAMCADPTSHAAILFVFAFNMLLNGRNFESFIGSFDLFSSANLISMIPLFPWITGSKISWNSSVKPGVLTSLWNSIISVFFLYPLLVLLVFVFPIMDRG